MTAPPIVLEDITVVFGDRAALDGLNLRIRRGVTTAVLGVSGSGKSLALKVAAGLLTPDDGRVLFEGEPIASMNEQEYQAMQARTGFHFQDAALWANKSLRENLSLPLLASDTGLSNREVNAFVTAAFASVDLRLDPDLRPAAISMGQRKMVSFLRATVTRPEILFLDDPGSFMDHVSLRQLLARVEEAKERGVSIVLATHDRVLARQLADDVAVLKDGRLVAEGAYSDVMASEDPELQELLRELV